MNIKFQVKLRSEKKSVLMKENWLKENKGNSKVQWKYINQLRGKDKKEIDISIYNDECRKINKEEEKYEIKIEWTKIYNKKPNDIEKIWNEEAKVEYQRNSKDSLKLTKYEKLVVNPDTGIITTKKHETTIPNQLSEHFDAAFVIKKKPVNKMNKIEFAEEEIKSQIKRSKLNKATGPDGIKNEIYKSLINSEICSKVLEKCFNLELQCKEKPDSWKTTTTILIPKKKKPTPSQYRPIALTYSSYKLFIGMIKTRIEHHLESNEILSELQPGFTAKRRLEDNLFILN